MLTKIRIQNFKQFDDVVEFELGPVTVLIGPNNSGKTTILQALMLWYRAMVLWNSGNEHLKRNPGGVFTDNALVHRSSIPVRIPSTLGLWNNMRSGNRGRGSIAIKRLIEIAVEGSNDNSTWSQNFEFAFRDDATIDASKPKSEHFFKEDNFIDIPRLFFLSLISTFAVSEKKQPKDEIYSFFALGREAEVLRNVCFNVYEEGQHWPSIVRQMKYVFGMDIQYPLYISELNELKLAYTNHNGITLDISASGGGMMRVLLSLAYMYHNPGSILLLDEPDAHLEILLQRQIYCLFKEVAEETNSQIILTTHSAEIMDEAFNRKDKIIAFTGSKLIAIDHSDKEQAKKDKYEFSKALKTIPFADYYKALQAGWILYLEDYTDYDILVEFADRLEPNKAQILRRAFVSHLHGNDYGKASNHLDGIRHLFPQTLGLILLDKSGKKYPSSKKKLRVEMWRRREIENYFCQPETLLAYAREGDADGHQEKVMQEILTDQIPPNAYNNINHIFWNQQVQVSEFMTEHIFKKYTEMLGKSYFLPKSKFHKLVKYIPDHLIDPEVIEKLDAIWDIAKDASST